MHDIGNLFNNKFKKAIIIKYSVKCLILNMALAFSGASKILCGLYKAKFNKIF
jgi:hypothetical protein